jgi:uncharacterized alkaline shock family protein YloU
MDTPARISPDVLARYAADAAMEVEGVRGLVGDRLRRHHGVRVTDASEAVALEVHVSVAAGTSIPTMGRDVQERVAGYLERMAGVAPATVDVVVHEIGR